MLIFYNWGGGEVAAGGGGELWHFTEFRGGILISSRYCQTALPPTLPNPPHPSPPPAYHIHLISY